MIILPLSHSPCQHTLKDAGGRVRPDNETLLKQLNGTMVAGCEAVVGVAERYQEAHQTASARPAEWYGQCEQSPPGEAETKRSIHPLRDRHCQSSSRKPGDGWTKEAEAKRPLKAFVNMQKFCESELHIKPETLAPHPFSAFMTCYLAITTFGPLDTSWKGYTE